MHLTACIANCCPRYLTWVPRDSSPASCPTRSMCLQERQSLLRLRFITHFLIRRRLSCEWWRRRDGKSNQKSKPCKFLAFISFHLRQLRLLVWPFAALVWPSILQSPGNASGSKLRH